LTLSFQTQNPISQQGTILLEWPTTVELFEDATFCRVNTFREILKEGTCTFDFARRELLVRYAFEELSQGYSGKVQIYLSRLKLPSTNKDPVPFVLKTFDDAEMRFAVDSLVFNPLLICDWPCFKCTENKAFCTQCWAQELEYMFRYKLESTCLQGCPEGWTSNGSQPPVCERCEFGCAGCLDNGLFGDSQKCTSCKPEFPFRTLNATDNSMACGVACDNGFYNSGEFLCSQCAKECKTCDS
jgi:hypothetical protein